MSKIITSNIVGYVYHPVYRDFNGQTRAVLVNGKLNTFMSMESCSKYISEVIKPAIKDEMDVKNYTKRLPFYKLGFLRKPIIYWHKMPPRERMVDLTAMYNTIKVAKR